jgi:hypothetical protein
MICPALLGRLAAGPDPPDAKPQPDLPSRFLEADLEAGGYWWLACGIGRRYRDKPRGTAKLSHRVAEYGDAMTRPQAFRAVCRSFASPVWPTRRPRTWPLGSQVKPSTETH